MTPKRIPLTLAQKLGLLLLAALLLTGCWYLLRPKTFTLMHSLLLDKSSSYATAAIYYYPAGMLLEQIFGPMSAISHRTSPEIYTLLDWNGKQRWRVTSPRFAQMDRVLALEYTEVKDPQTGRVTRLPRCNPELIKYAISHALSPDGRILVEAQISTTLTTLRRWRDGRAEGLVRIPQSQQRFLRTDHLLVTDSSHIWMFDANAGMYSFCCIDGTHVARGTHPIPFGSSASDCLSRLASACLSRDEQTLVCSNAMRGLSEDNTVQVTGSRVVVTPRARHDLHALLQQDKGPGNLQYQYNWYGYFANNADGSIKNGWQYGRLMNDGEICQRIGMQCHILVPEQHLHWHFTVNPGEFYAATTPGGRYALALSDGQPYTYADMLFSALGIHSKVDIPYFLLFERPGYLRAQLRLHARDNMKTALGLNSPWRFFIYEQGIPYCTNSWGLSPDGHHLWLAGCAQGSNQLGFFLYKW